MKFAITGAKYSGKDTFARAVQALDPEYRVAHFAGPLKQLAQQVYCMTEHQCSDPVAKEKPLAWPVPLDEGVSALRCIVGPKVRDRGLVATTPREVLQLLGTEMIRSVYPSYWLDALATQIRHLDKVLVPDCRFLNEADLIRAMGGKVVRIVRPDLESTDTHVSEREMRNISVDYEIVNRLDDRLMRAAAQLLEAVGER